jgi:5,10-methenyltetrahydrofolate synthetase
VTVVSEKERLRDRMRTLRRQRDFSWRERASAAIVSRLETLPTFQHAQIIQTYVALPHEVDTHELIQRLLRAGKQVAAPKIARPNELQQYFIQRFFRAATRRFWHSRAAGPSQLVRVAGTIRSRARARPGF